MTSLLRPALILFLLVNCALVTWVMSAIGADRWEVGEYRERLIAERAPDTPPPDVRGKVEGRGPSLKIEQAEVIRPKLAPDARAALVVRYSVSSSSTTPIDVKETRVVRYGDQVLLTRETVVKRSSGVWRTEYTLPVPANALEGAYTLTARVEMAGSTVPLTRGAPEEKVTMFTVERGKPSSPPDERRKPHIRLWSDKPRYKIGDSVIFSFETTADGYVTLVNAATSGTCNILFPNRYSDGSAVKANTRYSIPRSQDSYKLTVSGPPGIDLVYAVLSLGPMKSVLGDASSACDFRPVTRSINAVLKETPPDKQDRATIELEIGQ